MAKLKVKLGNEFSAMLKKLDSKTSDIFKRAVYNGVEPLANQMKGNLIGLPQEKFRFLRHTGERFKGVPINTKLDLVRSFGVTPIQKDAQGGVNAHIGFDGYGSFPTKSYPNGVPNQLAARAIEKGSEVRAPTPFARPAVNATRKKSVEAMKKTILGEIKKSKGR